MCKERADDGKGVCIDVVLEKKNNKFGKWGR